MKQILQFIFIISCTSLLSQTKVLSLENAKGIVADNLGSVTLWENQIDGYGNATQSDTNLGAEESQETYPGKTTVLFNKDGSFLELEGSSTHISDNSYSLFYVGKAENEETGKPASLLGNYDMSGGFSSCNGIRFVRLQDGKIGFDYARPNYTRVNVGSNEIPADDYFFFGFSMDASGNYQYFDSTSPIVTSGTITNTMHVNANENLKFNILEEVAGAKTYNHTEVVEVTMYDGTLDTTAFQNEYNRLATEYAELVTSEFSVTDVLPVIRTGLTKTSDIVISFSQNVDSNSDYPKIFVNKSNTEATGTWNLSLANTLTFTPAENWPANALVSLQIQEGLRSTENVAIGLAKGASYNFIVEAEVVFDYEDIEFTEIATVDFPIVGHKLPLKLTTPIINENTTEKFPVHIWVHGGGWSGGTQETSLAAYSPHKDYLAENLGIATLSISYRCSGSNGTFSLAMEDVNTAYQWALDNADTYNFDMTKVFFSGGSAGAPLAALAAQRLPNVIGLIGFNGIYDFVNDAGDFGASNWYKQNIPSETDNSAFFQLSDNPPATIMMHGDADTTISYTQSTLFADKINANGGSAEAVIYPEEVHAFFNPGKPAYEDVLIEMVNFINGVLNEQATSVTESAYVNDMDYVLGDVKQAFITNAITTEAKADNLLLGFKNMGVNGIRIPLFGRDVNGVDLNPNKPMFDYFYTQAVAQGFLIFANPAQGGGGARVANNMLNGDVPTVKNVPAATDELIARVLEFSAEYSNCKWINPFNEDGRATSSTWSVSQINSIYAALYNSVNGAELIGPCTWGIPAGIDMLQNTDISDYITVATTHNLGFNHNFWSDFIALADAENLPVWDSEVNHNDKFPDDPVKKGTRLERAIENKVDGLVLYNSWNTIDLTTGAINATGKKAMALYLLPSCGAIVDNNFDTDTALPDGWTEYSTSGSVTVVNDYLKFNLAQNTPSAYRTFTEVSNNSSLSFDVQGSRTTMNFQMDLVSSDGKYIASIALGKGTTDIKYSTAMVSAIPGTYIAGVIGTAKFAKNKNYSLSMYVDFDNQTVDFYNDGVLTLENIPFLEATTNFAKVDAKLLYMYDNSGTAFLDNLIIVEANESRIALSNAIDSSQNTINAAIVGDKYNQYPQSAVDNFQLVINNTKVVLVDCDSESNLIETSISNLQAAQTIFEASRVNDPILKIYSGYDFTGEEHEIYAGYYNGDLADYDDWAVSFTLEKGYMATFAENTNGTGASKVYVAVDNNLSINLPSDLQKKVSFIRVSPWFDVHKKGMAGKGTDVIQEFNNSWHYNWSISGSDVDDAKFVPNQWSGGSISNAQNLGKRMDIAHYMAFNEPDGSEQANMTVDTAIEKYEAMLASGLRLGSPATKDNADGQTWRDEFMTKAVTNGLRVDYIVVHYYKKTTALSFYNWLKAIHDKWQRPIWVKEFNYGAIWTDQPASNEAAGIGLKSYMDMLDTTSFVERYSVFTWQPDTPVYSLMSVRNPVTLSNSGIMYRDHEAPKAYTQEVYEQGNIAWDGSKNSDWTDGDNWSIGSEPTSINAVTIPTGMLNDPVINTSTGAELSDLIVDSEATLTIESGGSLIVNNTSSGNVTYNLNINDTNWHLISNPVGEVTYNTEWVDDNLIDNTTRTVGTNVGIATYNNTSDANGQWVYTEDTDMGTFNTGQGYAIKRDATGSDIGFTGTVQTANFSAVISVNDIDGANENRWTLIGNPYPSYINVNTLLSLLENATALEDNREAIYVFDNNKVGGAGYSAVTTGYIRPGQGFFVNSNSASTSLTISRDMLGHQAGVTLYKNSPLNTSVNLMISDGTNSKSTEINYLEGTTTGLDPRFDIGAFNGVSSATAFNIYSQLVTNNLGVDFAKQSLPDANYEKMIIPIGVSALKGKEITFSAKSFNLPDGLKIFLEDRANNTFTHLDKTDASYKVTLSENLNGIGRFYMHTSAQSVLSVNNALLESVSIYKLDNTTLRVVGLFQGNAGVKLFSLLGKEIISTSFKSKEVKDISLPKLATGIYIVQLETEKGKLNKKIIIE